jgi:hypothetical protein
LGHVCCEDPLVRGHDDKIKHALKVLIAASLAESKHIGFQSWGDADDRVKAMNFALLATDRDTEHAEALINEIIGETRKLVEQHWPDIEALAERLLIQGRVNFLKTEAGASEDTDTWCQRRGALAVNAALTNWCTEGGHHQRSRTPKNVCGYPKSRHLRGGTQVR